MAHKFGSGILDRVESKTLEEKISYNQVIAHNCYARADKLMANGTNTFAISMCLQYAAFHINQVRELLAEQYAEKEGRKLRMQADVLRYVLRSELRGTINESKHKFTVVYLDNTGNITSLQTEASLDRAYYNCDVVNKHERDNGRPEKFYVAAIV